MNTRIDYDKQGRQLRDLAAGDVHTLTGSRGTVVRCLRGRLWVTQEGDARDYVVPAGARFCAGGKGRIVASAVADDTQIAVYRVAPLPATDWSRNAVRIDAEFIESLREAARQERSRQLAALVRRAWRSVQRAWRYLLCSCSHGPTLRMREGG